MEISKELFAKSCKLIPGGVHSPVRSFKGLHQTPLFVHHAKGAYIYDEDKKSYIDFCMSFGPLILGHAHKKVSEDITHAISKGWSYGACEKYSLELASFIVDNISFIEQIRFMNSGTEAVMTAIRLSRGITGKDKIIKFDGCYHGHSDSLLIASGSGLVTDDRTASSAGIPDGVKNDTLVLELGNLELVKQVLEKYHKEVAAIIIEPIPANFGLLPQKADFLKGLRQLATEYNTLLIFDEVISGFRMGFGGMAQQLSITPDLVTYGKIIGGGMPVGAVAGLQKFMKHLAPQGDVYQAGTLSANPLAMVAGLSTLQELTADHYQTLEQNTQNIVGLFKDWLQNSPEAKSWSNYEVINKGSLFWIKSDGQGTKFADFYQLLLQKGIYLAPHAFEVGFCSLAHNEAVQEELKERLWKTN